MDEVGFAPARHRVDVEAYFRMGAAGVFDGAQRIELIEGDLIDMAPIGQEHEAVVAGLTEHLVLTCQGRATVWVQSSIRLSGWSAPQPDLCVLKRRPDFYGTGERAGTGDVLLLIEVSDSSLAYDRRVKLPLYARAGVGEVWIVDVAARVVEVHRTPSGERYEDVRSCAAGELVALALAPEIVVRLDLPFP